MDEVFQLVQELEKIRKIPQFIFIAGIMRTPIILVRQEVQKFVDKNADVKEIDFILESPGGSADLAYMLIRVLRENFEKVNIIIPFWAKSAATLFALGGSTIIMDEFGQFGPLDVQLKVDDELPDSEPISGLIDEYSLTTVENRGIELYQRMMLTLLKRSNNQNKDQVDIDIRIKKTILSKQVFEYIFNLYKPLFEQIDPYKIGEKSRSLAIAERYAERILEEYNKENLKVSIEDIVDFMVHDCPDHGYIVDYSIMSKFLVNVKKANEISEDYYKALAKLSLLFFKNLGTYGYVGFFNKKLLETKKEIKDTNNKVSASTELAEKEATKGEEKTPKE